MPIQMREIKKGAGVTYFSACMLDQVLYDQSPEVETASKPQLIAAGIK